MGGRGALLCDVTGRTPHPLQPSLGCTGWLWVLQRLHLVLRCNPSTTSVKVPPSLPLPLRLYLHRSVLLQCCSLMW